MLDDTVTPQFDPLREWQVGGPVDSIGLAAHRLPRIAARLAPAACLIFAAKPKLLRFILDPIIECVFRWETGKR